MYGILASHHGDKERAISYFVGSSAPMSQFMLGNLQYEKGKIEAAISSWRRAGAARFFVMQAYHHFNRRLYDEVITQLELSFKIDPTSLRSNEYRLLSESYLEQGRISDALEAWSKAFGADHQTGFQASYLLARIYLGKGEYELAERTFVKAIDNYPSEKSAYERKSVCIDIGNLFRDGAQKVYADKWYRMAKRIDTSNWP